MPPCYTPQHPPTKGGLEWSFSYSGKRLKAIRDVGGDGGRGNETELRARLGSKGFTQQARQCVTQTSPSHPGVRCIGEKLDLDFIATVTETP